MDRVDKALLILPLLPLFDLVSTLFSLSLGGSEVGFLARPILQQYGHIGLVFLAVSASGFLRVNRSHQLPSSNSPLPNPKNTHTSLASTSILHRHNCPHKTTNKTTTTHLKTRSPSFSCVFEGFFHEN